MKETAFMWLGGLVVAASIGVAGCARNGESTERSEAGHEFASVSSDTEHARAVGGERSGDDGEGEHARAEDGDGREGGGEHTRSESREGRKGGEHEGGEHEGGEHEGGDHEGGEGEEGEEPGGYIGLTETWDDVRRGARLVLSFDGASNAFVGVVENTTTRTLCAVRVEVHLSSGTELGPTPRVELPAGRMTQVELETRGESFERWTAHPEMSNCSGG